MIAVVVHTWEHGSPSWNFLDLGKHDEALARTIVEWQNADDGNWPEAKFVCHMPEVTFVSDRPTPWTELLSPERFFDYLKSREDYGYEEVEVWAEIFDMFTQEQLEELAIKFRSELENDAFHFIPGDSEPIFTPLFEQEVKARRQ